MATFSTAAPITKTAADKGPEVKPNNSENTQAYSIAAREELFAQFKTITSSTDEAYLINYALDNAAIVAITDVSGDITYINSKFCEISGYSKDELLGSNHRIIKSTEHHKDFFKKMYQEIAYGHIWQGEICNRHKDGSLYWVDTTIVPHVSAEGKLDSYTSIRFDITSRKHLEKKLLESKDYLKRLSNLDMLTGLSNDRHFLEQLKKQIHEYSRAQRIFRLALLDVDNFKKVNDSFGHNGGNKILQAISSRLKKLGNEHILASRIGGDEFALILTDDAANSEIDTYLERAIETMRQPIQIGYAELRCSVSVGVAVFPYDGNDTASLMKSADLALYQAKNSGRNCFKHFEPELEELAVRRSELLLEVEKDLQFHAFELHYQPVVPLQTSEPISFEALIRWRHPEKGLLTPKLFKESFTDPKISLALDKFVVEQAFRDIVFFRQEKIQFEKVAINLINSDFRLKAFVDRCLHLLKTTGTNPSRLCVEVSERMFLESNLNYIIQDLCSLHDAGIEIALDDFGTGYASLTHLRKLPVSRIKIDQSFVTNMVDSHEDQVIVNGIINMAHSLGKLVTAEGVETIEQVSLLRQMGCDHLQGWYFGKACAPSDLPSLMSSMPSTASLNMA